MRLAHYRLDYDQRSERGYPICADLVSSHAARQKAVLSQTPSQAQFENDPMNSAGSNSISTGAPGGSAGQRSAGATTGVENKQSAIHTKWVEERATGGPTGQDQI